ncbi:MAG TPA: AEC family transporter [Rhodocyclaceae bacterium]|nr:AEC family transporter [Rhodocyclaceae bacterium]
MEIAHRIVAILFPMYALSALGFFYSRRYPSDMSVANRLNMDVFVAAMIFAGLCTRSYDLATYGGLALSMVLMVLGSGAVAWTLAKVAGQPSLALAPPMMFSNVVNLGVPLAVLAFGDQALPWAIVLFVVSTGLHFSLGIWLLDHRTHVGNVWRNPAVLAAMAGFAVGESGIKLWPPLYMAIKMLGDISIPLALFALGVRITDVRPHHWRAGLLGAIARPLAGMAIAWPLAKLFGLTGRQADLLFVYGALPPAVINYVFAERFGKHPEQVAAIALVGNLASIFFLPLALAIVL